MLSSGKSKLIYGRFPFNNYQGPDPGDIKQLSTPVYFCPSDVLSVRIYYFPKTTSVNNSVLFKFN